MIPCVDHNGKEFPSKSARAYYHKQDAALVEARLKQGLSLEQALSAAAAGKLKVPCKDHLGNEFESVAAKTKFHNIPNIVYRARIKNGMSEQAALTAPLKACVKGGKVF